MKKINDAWNYISKPSTVSRLFSGFLCLSLFIMVFMPLEFNSDQLYPKADIQSQVLKTPLAPYDRGGIPLEEPANIKSQYPENEPILGQITAYLTPLATWISQNTNYFGTTIVSTPGGILDEILYYTRGMDTVLESSTLLISFMVFGWLYVNRNREEDENMEEIDNNV
ncbi:EhaF family protein [Methanococcus voltae]|uniref:Energy-converting hydrogenase A subunit F n=2 Tax=Methanococcus voltae TaxID=2188 RepID=A0A8J7UTI9_METVO|nr:EhaF family protein [Methanococcus voltae]MBP2172862.1 energy-converting hydrogenase A subunit F [Methanococcus voltae]MBP2201728.1 energy-converting hydrogenase A subunit F [Methanococcus voltae]MCS3922516.1 energy-converting hydrogenase A subunit F [Methanococcus voltae PS]